MYLVASSSNPFVLERLSQRYDARELLGFLASPDLVVPDPLGAVPLAVAPSGGFLLVLEQRAGGRGQGKDALAGAGRAFPV